MMPKLNDKQKRFAHEYLIDLNATQAAIRAGYSEKTAAQQAARLLTNVKIQAEIHKGKKRIANKIEITSERVAQEYAKIAFSNIKLLFEDGSMKDIESLPDDVAASISSVEILSHRFGKPGDDDDSGIEFVKKVRFWDKRKALEDLGKHLGFFEKDNQQKAGLIELINLIAAHSPDVAEKLRAMLKDHVAGK
jgi:phage terminase small subunit